MTVYYDSVGHMASDKGEEELHTFAKKMGLKRCWFQNHPRHPHYDLTTANARVRARKAGAVRIDSFELVARMYDAGFWVVQSQHARRFLKNYLKNKRKKRKRKELGR